MKDSNGNDIPSLRELEARKPNNMTLSDYFCKLYPVNSKALFVLAMEQEYMRCAMERILVENCKYGDMFPKVVFKGTSWLE
jgi:hypothetical protein